MSNVEVEALEKQIEALKKELGERDETIGLLTALTNELTAAGAKAKEEAAETLVEASRAVQGYIDEIRQLKETIVQQAIQKQQGPQIPMTPKAVHDMLGSMLGQMEAENG